MRLPPKGKPAIDTWALCVLVTVAPQLFGGAFAWATIAIAALSLAALATSLWVRREAASPIVDVVLIVMAFALVWACLQLAPWPEPVARALGLASLEAAQRLEGLEWSPVIPLTISRDPGSTMLHVLIGIAILSAFLAARLGGRSNVKPVAIATVASALLLAAEGLLHRLADADAVFGVYAPRFVQPQLLTPLMNGNHLGGFELLGALLAAGLAVERSSPSRRFWAVASALCALTVGATLSRGAIGSLAFGFLVLAAWLYGKGDERRGSVVPVAVPFAAGVAVAAFVGLEPILRRFETQGFDKLSTALRGLRLLEGSTWWLGIGRGAFSSAFVSEEGSIARYTHPENLLVQWTTEWGVPLGVGLVLVLGLALWARLRTAREPLVAATCIALGALSLQNLVDFSLEMAGVAAPAAVLLGAILPVRDPAGSRRSVRLSAVALAGFAALLLVIGPRVTDGNLQSIVDRLSGAMRYDRRDLFRATLRRGLRLHPTEPALALLAGTYAGALGHADAPRWLSIVMETAPGWGAPHVVAARWLADAGRLDQALLEIREAEQRHPGSAQNVVCEILGDHPSMAYLERAAPAAELRSAYLDRASTCSGLPPSLRSEIDLAILSDDPTRINAVRRHARRLSSRGDHQAALSVLRTGLENHPDNVGLWGALIRAHLDDGDPTSAQAALNATRARELDDKSLTMARARVEAALGDADAMRATLVQLRGNARGDPKQVAAAFALEGELEALLGNVEQALDAYAAADAASHESRALHRAAELALRTGRRAVARRAYETLCARDPKGAACRRAAQLAKDLGTQSEQRTLP